MGAPARQNLIDFFFNGGFTLTNPTGDRPDDVAGIDYQIARIGPRAMAADRDDGRLARHSERVIELTYLAQVTGWLQVQPDLQYVIRPGGGIADPRHPRHLLRNELVIGFRTTITF